MYSVPRRLYELKVLYLIPGTMSKGPLGPQELVRRQNILRSWAFHDTDVDVVDLDEGPVSIESAYDEYLAIPPMLTCAVEAEKQGYEAIILGCYGDPGLDAARELVSIPVVGPGQASMLAAAALGHRISVVTVLDSVVPLITKFTKEIGLESKLSSVRVANIPVLKLAADIDFSKQAIFGAAEQAILEDGADTLILGCMSMAFLGVSGEMERKFGIPVVNPARYALKFAESQVSAELSHSKRAFRVPPKIAAAKSVFMYEQIDTTR